MEKDKRIGDTEYACHQQQGGHPHPHLTENLAKQLTLLTIFIDSGDEIFPDGDPPLLLPQARHFYSLCIPRVDFLNLLLRSMSKPGPWAQAGPLSQEQGENGLCPTLPMRVNPLC